MVRVREAASVATLAFGGMFVAMALQALHVHPIQMYRYAVVAEASNAPAPVHIVPVRPAPRIAAARVFSAPQLAPVEQAKTSTDPVDAAAVAALTGRATPLATTPSPNALAQAAPQSTETAVTKTQQLAAAAPPQPAPAALSSPSPPAQPLSVDLASGEQPAAIAARIRESVPPELARYFNVFLYVSKASAGPWAQHMFIYHRGDDGDLVFEKAVAVSTGRERQEKYFTTTPTGLFELDPDRFDRVHFSARWHHAPMPWAMFLNYTIHGHLTGVALHSGIGHEADLGHRASGGCVRLPPEEAKALFQRFQQEEHGDVPVFAMDGSSTDVNGRMTRDPAGNPALAPGYRVLVLIQNEPGSAPLVAIIS